MVAFTHKPTKPHLARSRASRRAATARRALAHCHLCAHDCGVNRLAGELGICRAGPQARVFCAQVEVGDELELIPTFAIALSGCDLRCDFCITGESSWNPRAGQAIDLEILAERARAALASGARTVMILGGEPTIHLPDALEVASVMPPGARLIWKTNAHGSPEARELLDGVFDVWLVDFKFGNDSCAQRLAKVSDYGQIVRENLLWADKHTELIVRHLLMPGHVDCCWVPVAEWLAKNLPTVKVSLRAGFWPGWHSGRHPELRGTVPASESERAFVIAHDLGLRMIS